MDNIPSFHDKHLSSGPKTCNMRIFKGFHHPDLAKPCALTIGNFDGVHRGHQAMLALLNSEARHRGVPSCVMTFEPHPREYFAKRAGNPELAPPRVANLRDKLDELRHCGVDQCVVLRFDDPLANQAPESFVRDVLIKGLGATYILVGDDFRFGKERKGDHLMLSQMGEQLGLDVGKMNSYEISLPRSLTPLPDRSGLAQEALRVSSSAVREALGQGRMDVAAQLLGRPYAISGHVVYGRQLGRSLNARTLNLRFKAQSAATGGIFVVLVHGLAPKALHGVANFGVRPTLDPRDVNRGQILLETHCLDWPDHLPLNGGYGKIIKIELLHKLHDELKYDGLDALQKGIQDDCHHAREWFKSRPHL
jgi:riboflavin kinase/FMN adenylyltransferase